MAQLPYIECLPYYQTAYAFRIQTLQATHPKYPQTSHQLPATQVESCSTWIVRKMPHSSTDYTRRLSPRNAGRNYMMDRGCSCMNISKKDQSVRTDPFVRLVVDFLLERNVIVTGRCRSNYLCYGSLGRIC